MLNYTGCHLFDYNKCRIVGSYVVFERIDGEKLQDRFILPVIQQTTTTWPITSFPTIFQSWKASTKMILYGFGPKRKQPVTIVL